MKRSVIYSFVGHLAVLGILLGITSRRHPELEGARVYNVSIVVPGIVSPGSGSGKPGSGGKAEVGVAGMVGKPGKIGGTALPEPGPAKGTALVEPTKKPKRPMTRSDSLRPPAGNPDDIVLRVYGSGGTIGGGGDGTGGPGGMFGSGSGRPASAFEIALNGKIVANWNEELWKVIPERLACTIQFLIHSDGRVTDVSVFEPSSNDNFNAAAKRAIELARMPAPIDFGIPGSVHLARVTFVNRPD